MSSRWPFKLTNKKACPSFPAGSIIIFLIRGNIIRKRRHRLGVNRDYPVAFRPAAMKHPSLLNSHPANSNRSIPKPDSSSIQSSIIALSAAFWIHYVRLIQKQSEFPPQLKYWEAFFSAFSRLISLAGFSEAAPIKIKY